MPCDTCATHAIYRSEGGETKDENTERAAERGGSTEGKDKKKTAEKEEKGKAGRKSSGNEALSLPFWGPTDLLFDVRGPTCLYHTPERVYVYAYICVYVYARARE